MNKYKSKDVDIAAISVSRVWRVHNLLIDMTRKRHWIIVFCYMAWSTINILRQVTGKKNTDSGEHWFILLNLTNFGFVVFIIRSVDRETNNQIYITKTSKKKKQKYTSDHDAESYQRSNSSTCLSIRRPTQFDLKLFDLFLE